MVFKSTEHILQKFSPYLGASGDCFAGSSQHLLSEPLVETRISTYYKSHKLANTNHFEFFSIVLVVMLHGVRSVGVRNAMEEFLGKQYVMVSQEYFDEYLVFMGMGYISRKAAISLRPIHCLTRNDDGTYTFSLKSKLANSSCTFTTGEKFEETKADGVKVEALIIFDGNTMTHTQIEKNGRTSKHIREFHSDKLIVTTTAVGFDKTVTRIFQLVQ